jgi:hypothetical protein
VASRSTKGTSTGDEVLCIGLLGAFSIGAGDSVIAEDAWRLRKARTLMKLLALAPELPTNLCHLKQNIPPS